MTNTKTPQTPKEEYDFLVSHYCRFCEALDVKELMNKGFGFTEACTIIAMEWLEIEEEYMEENKINDWYYQCSSEFSCFVHYLEQEGVFSRSSDLWVRACKLNGF